MPDKRTYVKVPQEWLQGWSQFLVGGLLGAITSCVRVSM